jgi:hypothetical protein
MKRIFLLFIAWNASFITLIIFFLVSSLIYKPQQRVLGASINLSNNESEIFSSLPQPAPAIESKVISQEAKNQIIKNYLIKYEAPLVLQNEVDYLVQRANEYQVDPRLIVAIARKESTFCKNIAKLPDGTSSNNCGGLGIYGGTVQHFDSIHDWIDAEIRFMADAYIEHGVTDTCEIEKTHTPPAKGVWCAAINYYISEMQ